MKKDIQRQARTNQITAVAIVILFTYSLLLTFMYVNYVNARDVSDTSLADKLSDVDQRLYSLESK